MATTDNELNDLIINDISQEEYDNLVATGQVQEGQIYATDGTGGGSTTGGLESVAHDSSLEGAGTTASPLKVASTVIAQINGKADSTVVETLSSVVSENTTKLNTLRNDTDSLGDQVSGIEEKIPSSASATNQLATKADLPIGFDATVVDQLPATGEKGIIYLVPKDGEAPDVHDEYIWIDSEQKFEFIGSTAVDLTDYVKNTDYAAGSKGGVIRVDSSNYGTAITSGYLVSPVKTLEQYGNARAESLVGKGTLENVKYDLVKQGITTNTITLTDEEKAAAQAWLGVESGGDYLPTTGGTLTGAIEFEWSGQYMATQNVVLKTKYNRTDTGSTELRNVLTVDPTGDVFFYSRVFSDQVFPKATGGTGQFTTLGNTYYLWRNVYTTRLNAGYQNGVDSGDLIVPTEGGTLARLEDLEGLGGASLPILMTMWSDHVIDDMSWLRADTFSWQSGDVYKTAYEHLVDDYDSSDFEEAVWVDNEGSHIPVYTNTGKPQIGTTVYDTDIGEEIGTVSAIGDNYIDVDNYGTARRFYRARDLDVMAHSDTIGDITIRYALADDGHKICLPDQESKVMALYEATGVAWYYLLDTENKQFKLPRTKYGFTGLRDSVGGYVAPGLPNIEGDSGIVTTTGVPTGAFSRDGAKAKTWNTDSSNTYAGTTFDASRSNSIYGASDTVQPAATQMYLYFYVGNFEQSAVEQTAGITAETLNGKLDLDVGNVPKTTKETIVGWGMPDYTAGVSISGTTFTAPCDCFIAFYVGASVQNGAGGSISVDGATIDSLSTTSCTVAGYKHAWVAKGSVVNLVRGAGGNTAKYYPLKGAI